MILSTRSLLGWRSLFFTLLAIGGAGVGIYFAFFSKAGQPYSFSETLPKMVASFGRQARVVQILSSSDVVSYEVIASDGLLHRRDYELQSSETPGGGTGYSRHESNSERKPTAAERREAKVTLGSLSSGVVSDLLGRVGFPQSASSATLTGRTWVLESGVRPFDKYAALYDGSGLRQTASKATVFGAQASGGATTTRATATAPKPRAPARTRAPSNQTKAAGSASTGGVTVGGVDTGRLLSCVQHAHGDVNKIQDCAKRFTP